MSVNKYIKYNPWSLRHVDRDEFLTPFDRVFDEVFAAQFPELTKELGVGFFEKQSYPRVDVVDYADRVEILAEIPGLSKDEVTVEIQDNVLTISGQRLKKLDDKDLNGKYIRRELKHSNFKRSFTLGEIINKEEPLARFENGLLTVILNKVKPSIPSTKKVKIQ
jgi:HSP20 family protein